jgi:hypothetical protein
MNQVGFNSPPNKSAATISSANKEGFTTETRRLTEKGRREMKATNAEIIIPTRTWR